MDLIGGYLIRRMLDQKSQNGLNFSYCFYTFIISGRDQYVQSNENPMSAVPTDYKDFELGVIFGSIF